MQPQIHLAAALLASAVLALAGCGGGPAPAPGTVESSRDTTRDTTRTAQDPATEEVPTDDAAQGTSSTTSLRIPDIDLRTPVSPQGLRGGKINPRPNQVIWFTGHDRVAPGRVGTSVIAGHVTSGGRPDAFAPLEELENGDDVLVTRPGGTPQRFEVTSTRIVSKEKLTSSVQVWGENTSRRRIVLVTCDDELGFREDGHRAANFVAVAEPRE